MSPSSPPGDAVNARSTAQRLGIAILIALAISALLGGLWSLLGLPGSPGPVFGIVFGALFVFGGIASAAGHATRKAARALIDQRFPNGAYLRAADMANNFGVTSKGALQVRGNGALVLTNEALHFLAIASDDLTIPRGAIRATSLVRSHLGKSVGRQLLKIDYEGDSVAFFVEEPEAWITVLGVATPA
jgi:hypothetical protein